MIKFHIYIPKKKKFDFMANLVIFYHVSFWNFTILQIVTQKHSYI